MIAILIILTTKTQFVVTHHVDLHDTLFWCSKAKRDGSMVGSHGYEGPHEGGYDPLIILKGKRIALRENTKLRDFQVESFESNGSYDLRSNYPTKDYPAKLTHRELIIVGPGIKPKQLKFVQPKVNPPNEAMRKLFPPPKGMEDTTGIRNVSWKRWNEGFEIGQIEFSWNMDAAWRLALKDPSGRIQPFEKLVPGLKGYEVRGLHWLDKNWVLVSANKEDKRQQGLTLGFGSHLFWIELR